MIGGGDTGVELLGNNNIVSNSVISGNGISGNGGGIVIGSGSGNRVYNNLLNNTAVRNVYFLAASNNFFNTTNQTGARIYSAGTNIGGNYWTNSSGNGYSDTCTDSNSDGFCDTAWDALNNVNCSVGCSGDTDFLPLSNQYQLQVLWLKFNEGSGATAYDSSFYHNDGTLKNIYHLDVIASNPSLENPWYLVDNTDANHRIERPDKWNVGHTYDTAVSKMLALNETSIVKDGNSSLHFSLNTSTIINLESINIDDCINIFSIDESNYLEGGNFKYVINGGQTYCDQSMNFYNASGGFMCRSGQTIVTF
jgi:hypothetical protein